MSDEAKPQIGEDLFGDNPKNYSLTLAKGIAVMEMFGPDLRTITFQSAADRLGTSRATARRLILTLHAMGYLDRTNEGYQLTARCLAISRSFLAGNSILSMLADKVRRLATQIDCPCSIVSLSGPDVMFLCRDPSRRVYASQLALGDRLPAHASAGGKLLLATLEDAAIRDWFAAHSPGQVASRTITDPDTMLADAAEIRMRGYAVSEGELEDSLVSLAVPVRDHAGAIKLALIISQFSTRMTADEVAAHYLEPVLAAAEDISQTYADFLRHNA
ncbi:IclR family transcriptional regulator domain-containing protein [Halovulum sp. GXIMD14794]